MILKGIIYLTICFKIVRFILKKTRKKDIILGKLLKWQSQTKSFLSLQGLKALFYYLWSRNKVLLPESLTTFSLKFSWKKYLINILAVYFSLLTHFYWCPLTLLLPSLMLLMFWVALLLLLILFVLLLLFFFVL